MGKWLLVSALLMPAVAQAGPHPFAPPADRTEPASYAVEAPAAHGHISSGWGLYATLRGRSMDLASRDWAEDPRVQPRDVEAGYGWRDGKTTALIGYDQHDYGPKYQRMVSYTQRDPNEPPPVNSAGVLGFSLVLHGR